MDKIVSAEDGRLDNERVPIVLFSDSNAIADRNAFLLGLSNKNPADDIYSIVEKLVRLDVDTVAIACNAAHSSSIFRTLESKIAESGLGVDLLHLIELLAERISSSKRFERIGVLSIEGTYHSRVYNESFAAYNIEVLTLPEPLVGQMHDVIWNPEFGVKAHSEPTHPEARIRANRVMDHFVENGADALLLGCTEYPILITNQEYRGIPVIDTNGLFGDLIIQSYEKK